MAIVPPRDFWTSSSDGLSVNGVLYATAPLTITDNTISVADASATGAGVVSTGVQTLAGPKNLRDGMQIGGGPPVTAISTDPLLAADSDTTLPSQHAVKMYVDNHGGGGGSYIGAVTEPLYVALSTLYVREASDLTGGVITTGVQTIAGSKTHTGDLVVASATPAVSSASGSLRIIGGAGVAGALYAYEGLSIDRPLSDPASKPYVRATAPGASLQLYNGTGYSFPTSPMIELVAQSSGGHLTLTPGQGGSLAVYTGTYLGGSVPTIALTVSDTTVTSSKPVTAVGYTGTNGLTITGVNSGYIRATGASTPLQLYAAAGYSLATTALVSVKPVSLGGNVEITPTPNGALTVFAGATPTPALIVNDLGVAAARPLLIGSAVAPQLSVLNGSARLDILVGSDGDVVLNASGDDLNIHSTDTVHILNATPSTSTMTGALTVTGGVGVAGDLWARTLVASSTVTPQLQLYYSPSVDAAISVTNAGYMVLKASGAAVVTTDNAFLQVLNTGAAVSPVTGAIRCSGGIGAVGSINAGGSITSVGSVSTGTSYIAVPLGAVALELSSPSSYLRATMALDGTVALSASVGVTLGGWPLATVESITVVTTLTGAATGVAIAVHYERVGSTVTASLPAVSATAVVTDVIGFAAGTPIPVGFRPNLDYHGQIMVLNRGSALFQPGSYLLGLGGALTVYDDLVGGTFTSGRLVGWPATSLRWTGA